MDKDKEKEKELFTIPTSSNTGRIAAFAAGVAAVLGGGLWALSHFFPHLFR